MCIDLLASQRTSEGCGVRLPRLWLRNTFGHLQWDLSFNVWEIQIKSFVKIGRESGSRSRQGSGQPSILAFPHNDWGFVTAFFQKEEKWENSGFFVK